MHTRLITLFAVSLASLGCSTLNIGSLRETYAPDKSLEIICGEFTETSMTALNKRLDAIYKRGLRLAASGTVTDTFLVFGSTRSVLCFEGPASSAGTVEDDVSGESEWKRSFKRR